MNKSLIIGILFIVSLMLGMIATLVIMEAKEKDPIIEVLNIKESLYEGHCVYRLTLATQSENTNTTTLMLMPCGIESGTYTLKEE